MLYIIYVFAQDNFVKRMANIKLRLYGSVVLKQINILNLSTHTHIDLVLISFHILVLWKILDIHRYPKYR